MLYTRIAAAFMVYNAIHVASAYAYPYFCAPAHWYGIILSPFMTHAPHCYALRWVMNASAKEINATFLLVGSYFLGKHY